MARAVHETPGQQYQRFGRGKSFAQSMSDHVAIALVVYTLMLIFVVTPSVETKGLSIFPYFLLVLLVGGIIPVFRWFEKRWINAVNVDWQMPGLDAGGEADRRVRRRFTIDRLLLWAIALAIPFLIAVICRSAKAFF